MNVVILAGIALGLAAFEYVAGQPYPLFSSYMIRPLATGCIVGAVGLFLVLTGVLVLLDAHLDPRGVHHG